MVVQSQYPSNGFLLHRNMQQQGSKIQQEGDEAFPHHITSSLGMNCNKRAREDTVYPFSQSQHPNSLVSSSLQLSLGQQQQQPQFQSCQSCSILSQHEFTTQIHTHTDQIHNFLQAQGEQLRLRLADKRQGHYRAILGAAEEFLARRLLEKYLELEIAALRQAELEAQASHLYAEAQAWRDRVAAQESAASILQSRLNQAIMTKGQDTCDVDAESVYIDQEYAALSCVSGCKACGKRVASMVMLPCRHICVCRECDGVIQTCPLCLSFKHSSIEVFLS